MGYKVHLSLDPDSRLISDVETFSGSTNEAVAIEMAWCWLRYQPQSWLSRWDQERFGRGGARARKVGIVALARKLLIELWRFLEYGVIPDGAALKA